jgi:UDP-glucose 4-epimerase
MGAALASEPLHLYGHPTATRDYVYVDDVASAVVAAHRATHVPPIVNVGSGVATTLKELVGALERVVAPRAIDVVEHAARDTDTEHSVLDVSLAREALGWQPQVDLEHGVRQMWKWRQTQ